MMTENRPRLPDEAYSPREICPQKTAFFPCVNHCDRLSAPSDLVPLQQFNDRCQRYRMPLYGFRTGQTAVSRKIIKREQYKWAVQMRKTI